MRLPRIFALCLLPWALACGSEEREPDPQPSTAEATTESEPPTEMPTPPIPPASMVQQLQGQLVLDHREVQTYLHMERADNMPLRLYAVPELAEGAAALEAGDGPVEVVGTPDEARFRFTALEDLEGSRVRVRFEIPAEGVSGHVDLELRDWEWSVLDAEVVER